MCKSNRQLARVYSFVNWQVHTAQAVREERVGPNFNLFCVYSIICNSTGVKSFKWLKNTLVVCRLLEHFVVERCGSMRITAGLLLR